MPVAGSSVTSAPLAVTATIAGGVAAAVPVEAAADADVVGVAVTVGAGEGELLPPQADSTLAADTTAREKRAIPAGEWNTCRSR